VTEVRPDIATMPFEAALAELEQIVDQLEKGAVALDESIRLFEKITLAADGGFKGVVPLDND
jgi:exodeoxyribonuclease VII small subunit